MPNVPQDPVVHLYESVATLGTTSPVSTGAARIYTFILALSELFTAYNLFAKSYDRTLRVQINNFSTPTLEIPAMVRGQEFPNGVR